MVTHRPAVLDLVTRVMVVDAGRVVLDGPKAKVLALLSGQAAAVQSAPAAACAASVPPAVAVPTETEAVA